MSDRVMLCRYKLSKPLKIQDDEIETIELAEPTTDQILDIGPPLTIFSNGGIKQDLKVAFEYIKALSTVHEPYLKKMRPADLIGLSNEVIAFFSDQSQETLSE